MIEQSRIESEFGANIGAWRNYAIAFPLKAMHEALDPQFRRTIVCEGNWLLSAALVIMSNKQRIPFWTMMFGFYRKKPGITFQNIAKYPAVEIINWPADVRDVVSRAAGTLICLAGGDGAAKIDILRYTIRAQRVLTGVEARHVLQESKNKHPLIAQL